MPRDDFSPETKKRLAQRAGYQCSICNIITVGPSNESADAINNTGIAAHIAAASPGGRRFDPKQTSEQRSSIDNGIWLCSYHADLIDGDEITYTISYLLTIKRNHEIKIQYKQKGFNVDNGMMTEIEICNLGPIIDHINLTFYNRNIILGDNGVGKTMICEMITSLTNKEFLTRWKRQRQLRGNAYCHLHYFRNESNKFTIAINSRSVVTYKLNDIEYPFLDPAITTFYPKEEFFAFLNMTKAEYIEQADKGLEAIDLLENDLIYGLARYFRLSKDEFATVISAMATERKYFIHDIRLSEDRKDLEVNYGFTMDRGYHSFHSYSGGEKQRIILEICIRIASFYARFKPTILLIEHTSFGTIDIAGINHLLKILREEKLGFQFFFTSMVERKELDTTGYAVWELKRGPSTRSVKAFGP